MLQDFEVLTLVFSGKMLNFVVSAEQFRLSATKHLYHATIFDNYPRLQPH